VASGVLTLPPGAAGGPDLMGSTPVPLAGSGPPTFGCCSVNAPGLSRVTHRAGVMAGHDGTVNSRSRTSGCSTEGTPSTACCVDSPPQARSDVAQINGSTGTRTTQGSARGYSGSLPNIPPNLFCASSMAFFWAFQLRSAMSVIAFC
jgi:hypothetical protein